LAANLPQISTARCHLGSQYRHEQGGERTAAMTGPGYDILVVLHVLSAVIGFGAVGVTGTYAARAASAEQPRKDPRLGRYFRPGTNWAERSLLLTPLLGGLVLGIGDRPAASQSWPWIGLGCWAIAAAIASAWSWPAERRIQDWLAWKGDPKEVTTDLVQFQQACRVVVRASSVISICFFVAVVAMVSQPG
jgi:hypothetical protein